MDRQDSGLTKVAMGVLTFNSVLAIYNSWGDAASVAIVLTADAALVLLFLCFREFEQDVRARDTKIKAALWVITTLLTAMFSGYPSKVAPLVVGALVFLCLRELERGHQIGLGGRYAELLKMGLGVVACDAALAHHHAHGDDAGSLAAPLVFVAYGGFVTLTWLFLRRFDGRARGAGGQ